MVRLIIIWDNLNYMNSLLSDIFNILIVVSVASYYVKLDLILEIICIEI